MKAELSIKDGISIYEMDYKIGHESEHISFSSNGFITHNWEEILLTEHNAKEIISILQQYIGEE